MIAYYAEKGDQSLETVNSCAVLCPTMYEEKQTEIIWIAFFFFFLKCLTIFSIITKQTLPGKRTQPKKNVYLRTKF